MYQVSDQFVGQDCPKAVLDELGHLFSDEVSMLGSGGVATTTDALVFLFKGPRFGLGLDRDSVVPPLGKETGRRMIKVFQLGGQVGRTSEVGDKLLPALGLGVTGSQFAN